MSNSNSRWTIVSESEFPWEREALAYIRERLPDCEPFRAWCNFEFIAEDGSLNEVDLLVVSRYKVFLVEIKSRPGLLQGDGGTWTWTLDGKTRADDNPLILADRKSKKLKSLLSRQTALKKVRIPYVDPVIFLSAPDLRCELTDTGRTSVFMRAEAQRDGRPSIMEVLKGEVDSRTGQPSPAHWALEAEVSRAFSRAMDQAGIRPSQRSRRIGDYLLDQLLLETDAYQDWTAHHVAMPKVLRRVRLYPNALQASELSRVERRQAAEREFLLFDGISHPGILKASDFTEHERELAQRALDGVYGVDLNPYAVAISIGLIEKPEYKRRWNTPAWEDLEKEALREWLLDRLEDARYWANEDPMPQTVHDLASKVQTDVKFLQVAELYVGHEGVDLKRLVSELVESESVPFLPVLRYKESGLRHRAVWERTWELQRREDAGEDMGTIPAPPKYKQVDFLSATCWRLRGPLDVPKERFISYPHCSRDGDPSLLVGWAGWDHLQQARALTGYLTQVVTNEGWSPERLTPLFAGLQELIPWLKQWHNEIDPEYDQRMGEFFEGYLLEQLHLHQLTATDLKTWKPPASAARRGRRPSVSV